MTRRLTVQEIVDETVEYYRTHPRAITSKEACVYYSCEADRNRARDDEEFPPIGSMCAVGRCLADPPSYAGTYGLVSGMLSILEDLQNKYKGHTLGFWREMQMLHDIPRFWEKNDQGGWDLTEDGWEKADSIITMFGDGE